MNDRFSDKEIESQIHQLSNQIDLVYNDEVKTIINTYISSGRKNTEVILSRSQYYFPLIEQIITENNLPEELKYLSVIESGLRPTVKSKVGAVGLWQFMSGTAKEYDLRIHSYIDERKDVKKSTQAALEYLTNLYRRYDDWTLALAAYNCGPGNINKAIRKAGGKKDFWEIRKYLPKETRRYLPKLVATMYVMNHFHDYGLNDKAQKFSEYSAFGVANIHNKTSFDHISEYSGLSVKEIKKHNPSYMHNYIPSSSRGNNLIMPEGYLLTYLQNMQLMDNFTGVFYLKSAIISIPKATIQPEIKELKRAFIQNFTLDPAEINEIAVSEAKISSNIGNISFSPVIQPKRTHRLAKRQTLTAWLRENNIDLSIFNAEVNENGVITLVEK